MYPALQSFEGLGFRVWSLEFGAWAARQLRTVLRTAGRVDRLPLKADVFMAESFGLIAGRLPCEMLRQPGGNT